MKILSLFYSFRVTSSNIIVKGLHCHKNQISCLKSTNEIFQQYPLHFKKETLNGLLLT